MKKLFLALAILFLPSLAWAQCNGLFPPSTVCGNNGVVPATPTPVLGSSTFPAMPPYSVVCNPTGITAFPQPGCTTVVLGSGTFVSTGPYLPITNAASLLDVLVGSSGAPITTTTPSPNIMVQTWYNSANFNNIASPLISSAMKQSSANGASVTGATGFGQDNVGGAGSFVEGLRGVGALEAGTHGEGTGVVGIGRVELGVGYDYVLGIEAEVVNVTGTNAPVYTSFTSAQFIASFLATGDGTHTSDVAFLVNPFSQTGYGAGFVVAENSITPSGAAFVNRASIAVGLDLSVASAAYSIAQIKGVGGWRLLQDGNVAVDNTKSGVLAYSINNLDTGAGSVAQMQLNTNAGTLSVGATTIAGTAFGGLTWTGAGPTAIQAANAAGHIAFATGSGPTDAITISSSQVIQLPAVATGTPAASLCIDASNNIIKKTTTGPCI